MEWFKAAVDAASAVLPPSVTKDLNEFVDTVARDTTAVLQREGAEAPTQPSENTDDASTSAQLPLPPAAPSAASPRVAMEEPPPAPSAAQTTLAAAEQALQSDDLPGWDDDEDSSAASAAQQKRATSTENTS